MVCYGSDHDWSANRGVELTVVLGLSGGAFQHQFNEPSHQTHEKGPDSVAVGLGG